MSQSHRQYPEEAGVMLAAQDGSERYYFKTPVNSLMSVPAMDAEQARELAADEYRGFGPEDFEQVSGFDAYDPEPYPDPVESGRAVTEHDLWMLRLAMRTRYTSRQNPTERMIQAIVDEWDDADSVPLGDVEALQAAAGIGPASASRIVGAAVANGLIERPKRGEA